ncbi:SDR family NAD(P)-dependent oxidoreductase [Flavobacteriaceae bacterium M23B6Z8]
MNGITPLIIKTSWLYREKGLKEKYMIDFIEYVVSELKQKRLTKGNALSLIKQFSQNSSNTKSVAVLHPLLHTNTSDLYQQSYSSILKGTEHFLKDHQVKLQENQSVKILPGVAYLEMAYAAINDALPGLSESSTLELKSIVWLKPFFVSESTRICIALDTIEEEQIHFEIYSETEDVAGNIEETIHCEGKINYFDKRALPVLDVSMLESRMNKGKLSKESIYGAYDSMGLLYGPAHRVLSTIHQGEDEVLAELQLPESLVKESNGYVLHPSMMDGALQATLGLISDLDVLPENPRMPFALENIQIINACTENMFAWVRYAPGSNSEDKVTKLDIDICDREGNIRIQIKGFISKTVVASNQSLKKETAAIGRLLARQEWETLDYKTISPSTKSIFEQKHILLIDLPKVDAEEVQNSFSNTECAVFEVTSETTIAEHYTELALKSFKKIQEIVKSKPAKNTHIQIVIANTVENEILTGLSAMLKTARLENPQLSGQVILIDHNQSTSDVTAYLRFYESTPQETLLKFEKGVHYAKRLKEIDSVEGQAELSFQENGVYLITGGLGGLGTLFAEEILGKTKGATVILTGRSALDNDQTTKLEIFKKYNKRVEYMQLDVSDLKETKKCIEAVVEKYGQLTGIIHSAGMISDNYILKKSEEEFKNVLRPKVSGAYNLIEATEKIDLDFIALFSSGVAVMGNAGQADYAIANGFLDQFAIYKNRFFENTQQKTKIYSINWPLWQNGGMVLDQQILAMMQEQTGIIPLKTPTGLAAFHQSIALNSSQTLVVEGDLLKIREFLFSTADEFVEEVQEIESTTTLPGDSDRKADAPDNLLEKTKAYLKKQFSSVLKIPVHKIDTSAALERYGIDSVVAMNLTGQLEKSFGTLSKTLFFEYQTIDELSEYISESFQEKLISLLSLQTQPEKRKEKPTVSAPLQKETQTKRRTKKRRRFYQASDRQSNSQTISVQRIHDEPIAIVGLSGRYPESENIEAYWNNLRNGKDCVTEIPKDRWDWREYYNEDAVELGTHTSKWGGFIKGVDEFDPRFFNISPREASYIDPQERLFLQHSWMAIEDAGLTRASLQIPADDDQSGQVGVYVGVMYGEYNLSGSLASIANRVSYFLNLHGPSMTLDTMCSSSLTAIHLACQDLKLGRTSLAIAGGVNVSIDANKYSMLSAGQFISSDGHCQSFGEGGDGYIPGEGVGAVVLKRLSEAVKDKNHIYGVIKGSALNHGGKTNGYTVPNPIAQASAISRALKESGTSPKHISFVEAHGTGTKLGDPIEIAALTKAYQLSGENHCLVGSSKSNIGHCESAAGIAGLTKVLLQMKYQQIVPSLHSKKLNPNIDFEKTPFEINQTLKTWERPTVDGKEMLRTAGLSSFGAGGSNAHIIIEEYPVNVTNTNVYPENSFTIIPLSARTKQQLNQKAVDLFNFIKNNQDAEHKLPELSALAYTLQVGREAMDERLAFIVNSIDELKEKLSALVQGASEIEDMYYGQVKENKDTLALFNTDEDFQETIDKWIQQKKYSKIADLWVKGLNLNWSKLYEDEKPSLVSLPTYPFAKEKYWNDPELRGKLEIKDKSSSRLHPLVHMNTSDMDKVSFSSTFTGEEFFLKEYQLKLNGAPAQKALTSIAGLEMARAAIEFGKSDTQTLNYFELQEVLWGKPFVLNGDQKIDITLFKEDIHQIDFEIASQTNGEEIIHSQGKALFKQEQDLFRINLDSIQNQFSQKQEAKDLYRTFESLGLHYGTKNQVITSASFAADQILAKVRLPQIIEKTHSDFVLHPGILDSVVQASMYLIIHQRSQANLYVPVSAEVVSIHAACDKEMYVWVRSSNNNGSVLSIDADLCDSNGIICARIKGLNLQQIELASTTESSAASISQPVELIDFSDDQLEKPDNIALTDFDELEIKTENPILSKPQNITLIDSSNLVMNSSEENREVKKISLDNPKETIPLNYDIEEIEENPNDTFLSTYHQDGKNYPETSEPLLMASEPITDYTKQSLKRLLTVTLAEALYLEPSEIDTDQSFIDLGLDSIVGVEWIKTINKKLGIELSSTKIYDYATVNDLAKFLDSEMEKERKASSHSTVAENKKGNAPEGSVEHSVNEYS